jgi:hypothetical protein
MVHGNLYLGAPVGALWIDQPQQRESFEQRECGCIARYTLMICDYQVPVDGAVA